MNTTFIKGAISLAGRVFVYSKIIDGIKFRERTKFQSELEKLRYENAMLELRNVTQQKLIDILNEKLEKEGTEER